MKKIKTERKKLGQLACKTIREADRQYSYGQIDSIEYQRQIVAAINALEDLTDGLREGKY